jgi:hypothetical protein
LRGTSLNALFGESEDWISRRLPGNTKLLHVNDTISLNNFVNKSADFMLIHGPDLVKAVFIALLEPLELVLELFELLGELLIVVSELDVISLVLLALSLELLFDSSEDVLISSLLGLETGDSVVVDLFSLFEDLEVELELLLIESVHTLHIFHALL